MQPHSSQSGSQDLDKSYIKLQISRKWKRLWMPASIIYAMLYHIGFKFDATALLHQFFFFHIQRSRILHQFFGFDMQRTSRIMKFPPNYVHYSTLSDTSELAKVKEVYTARDEFKVR